MVAYYSNGVSFYLHLRLYSSFQTTWLGAEAGTFEFALALFAGLVVFETFSVCVNGAPTLIQSNAPYVKKVVFPIEILPCVMLISSLLTAFVSILLLLGFTYVVRGELSPTIAYLPLILLPYYVFVLGLTWLIASLGVFFKDLQHIVSMVSLMLMFLSAIFYPLNAIPLPYRSVMQFNPILIVIEQCRLVILKGESPDSISLIILGGLALLLAWLGFAIFRKVQTNIRGSIIK